MNPLNPLAWKREHQIIWGFVILAGGVAGLLIGFLASPLSRMAGADIGLMFIAWLHYPQAFWPWVLAGAVTAGLAYYSGDLLTGAR